MPSSWRRAGPFAAAALLAVHAILAWLCRAPGISFGGDDAKYLLLARALRGLSYRELWIAGTPWHAQYPPAFPAVLAVLSAVLGERVDLLVLFNILCSVVSLGLAWWTVRRLSSDGVALATLAVLAVNPFLITWAGLLLSEPMFMLLSTAVITLLAAPEPGRGRLGLASALAILAALTRTAGLPVAVTVGALWLLQRRWKAALAHAAACALVLGGWYLWLKTHAPQASVTYMTTIGTTTQRASSSPFQYLNQVIARALEYTNLAVPVGLTAPSVPGTVLDNLLIVGVIGVAVVTALVTLRRRWTALVLYLPLSIGLLSLWPIVETRFVTPLLPLLAETVMLGLAALPGQRRERWGIVAAAVVALALVAGGVPQTAALAADRSQCVRGSSPPDPSCEPHDPASFFAAVAWIRDHLPPDAVVMSAKPSVLYYYSGRRSILTRPPTARDSTVFLRRLEDSGAGWILLSSLNWGEIAVGRQLRGGCHKLAVEREFSPRTYLLRIDPPAADSSACRALEVYRRATFGRDVNRDR